MLGARIAFIFAIGASVGLLGDACHVASGTTVYEPTSWPFVWLSPLWFPMLCGAGVVAVASAGRALGLPRSVRSRSQAASAIFAMIVLYALTGMLRSQAPTVAVLLIGGLALLTWCLWDPSARCLALAVVTAVASTCAEALCARAGTHHYASDSSSLYGLAPWLPCLFFALGAVASGLWNALWESQ